MKTRQLKKKIGAVILGFSIISGVGLAMSSTAQAQYPNAQQDRRDQDRGRDNNGRWHRRSNDDYPNWGGSFQLRQTALNAGFNEGLKEGRNDLKKHRRSNFRDSNTYRKATKDYSRRDGDQGLYQRYFREAFENGYGAGYAGN
jgi:hypothetical protein